MASLLDLVKHYQHNIEKYPKNADEQKVLRAIDKLFSLDVKVQHLQETGVGRTVNALRKEPGMVGKAARALVYKWKLMVASEESDEEEDHNDNSTQNEGEKDSDDGQHSQNRSRIGPEDQRHMNGNHSGSKRKYHSSEDEPDTKKSKHSHTSDSNDYKKGNIQPKTEPESDSQSSNSHSGSADEFQSSEEDRKPVKIKTEPEDKPSASSKHSANSHNKHISSESTSSRKPHESSEQRDSKISKHSSDSRHNSEKSSKSTQSSKESCSKSTEKEHSFDKRHSSDKNPKTDKERARGKEESKSSSKHSSDKSKSLHKNESSSDKSKSQENSKSDKKSKSDKEKDKSSSEKQTHDKHKSKDSNSSRERSSSSSKEKSKDSISSSSKEKARSCSSSHSKSEKKHSSSNEKSDKYRGDSKSKSEKSEERSNEKKSSHKSSSSKKSKSSSSNKSKEEEPKKSQSFNTDSDDDGIGCESGASFAEALGMVVPTKPKKKQSTTPIKDAFSPNNTSNDLSPLSLLAPHAKLAPLPALEISALPEITPNYKPRPPPKFIPHFTEEELGVAISSKNQRTKVYSGNKIIGKVPSLYDMCVQILQEHIDALEYTGGVPYEILKPVVDKATPSQLFMLEHYNPYLMEDTDHLWKGHCEKHFRCKKRQEMETWREMFMRCQEEQESKLRSLTANIKMTQEAKKAPIKQTKMAYVDSVVKPPRNIARKQAVHGTAHVATASPAARVAALAAAPNVLRGGVRAPPAPSHPAHARDKPKKAPLMAKALQLMRGRKR